MKTIIWKEWRQCGWIVAAGFAVMSLALWYTTRTSNLIFDATGQWPAYATLIGSVFALLLGALQSRGDHHPAARALLLHRSVSPATIFWGKYVAGITMYIAALVPPFLYLAVYFLIDQRQSIAAQPSMVLPGLFGALAGYAFWPVAVTIVHSDAKFYGSRLLVMVGCGSLLAGLVISLGDTCNGLVWLGWALVPHVFATVLAKQTFAHNRVKDAPQRVMLWFANAFALLLCFVFGVGTLMERPYRGKRYSVTVGPDAQPWLVEQSYGTTTTKLKMAPLSTERSVRELVKIHKDLDHAEYFQVANLGQSSVNQSMIRLSSFTDSGPSEQQHEVVFDNVVGEVLVYRNQGFGLELIRKITPRSERIGEFIAQANFMQSVAGHSTALSYQFGNAYQLSNSSQSLIACSNGLFLVGDGVESVTRLLEFPAGSDVSRIASSIDDDVHSFKHAIRVDDDVILLSLKPTENDSKTRGERRAEITADAISIEQVRIPQRLRQFDSFYLARSPGDQEKFVGIGNPPATASQTPVDVLRIEFNAAGETIEQTVYQEQLGFDRLHGSQPSVAAFVPAGMFAIAAVVDRVISERPQLVSQMWSAAFTEPSHLVWGMFTALLGLAIAIGVARRRCLSNRQTWWWSLGGALFGPVGALAILTVYPRINRQACAACGKMTRVEVSTCIHCGSKETELPRRGIEIFEGENSNRRDALMNA